MNRNEIKFFLTFRLLSQACVGALIGAFISLLFVSFIFKVGGKPAQLPNEMLNWNLNNVLFKPREKGFYLFTLLFSFIGAYLMTGRRWTFNLALLFLGLVASIPLTNYLAREILQNNGSRILLFTLVILLALFVSFLNRTATPINQYNSLVSSNYHFHWKTYLSFLLVVTVLLLPKSFIEIAAHIIQQETGMHVVSFMIGPAIYFLGKDLTPGIDYFTQYSLGMGWVFSHLLGSNLEATMVHYARFIIIAMWLFYAELCALLAWLYRSWIPAVIISLLSLVLLFHTKIHFFDPSSSILRYPLLGLCAYFLANWIKYPSSIFRLVVLAGAIALSIFLNTETGIIISLSVALAALLSARKPFSCLLPLLCLGIMSFFLLIAILLGIYGNRILHEDFMFSVIEPLLIYGKIGFGGWPISWNLLDGNWFYNLVAPGITLATLALIPRFARDTEADQPRLSVLAFFAVSGLLMMAKYINMSIIAVWQMNALGFLVLMGWWGMLLVHHLKEIRLEIPLTNRMISCSLLICGVFTLSALWMVLFSNDVRNPSQYGLRSWIYYPSFVRSFLYQSKKCADFSCISNQPTENDIALIKQRTKPGEQVAIIDLHDWTYLIGAHRPPLMFFLPSIDIFTKNQLEGTLRRLKSAPYLFITKGPNNQPDIGGALKDELLPTFKKMYVFAGAGEHLTAWRRKDITVPQS